MLDKKHHKLGSIVAIVSSVILIAIATGLLLNRQYLMDQLVVWSYQPPSNIQTIEERVDFTKTGRFYFYVTQPAIADASTFNQDCPRQETTSPILGCYSLGRIHIYDITNDQLDGIEEVTAAHEMLHAAWDRLSPSEQKRMGQLLRAQYASINSPDLKTRMDYYERTEPGQFENELHSIIGTEIDSLTPELEAYYDRYFEDRQKVLALHKQYDTLFKVLRTQSVSLYEELTDLADSVQTRSTQYVSDANTLSSDITSFNTRANNGSFSSISQFNKERAALVARSRQLDDYRDAINNDIATYEEKYEQYQMLSVQIQALNNSIDSFRALEPVPSL